jgi:hypothetical protein
MDQNHIWQGRQDRKIMNYTTGDYVRVIKGPIGNKGARFGIVTEALLSLPYIVITIHGWDPKYQPVNKCYAKAEELEKMTEDEFFLACI